MVGSANEEDGDCGSDYLSKSPRRGFFICFSSRFHGLICFILTF